MFKGLYEAEDLFLKEVADMVPECASASFTWPNRCRVSENLCLVILHTCAD